MLVSHRTLIRVFGAAATTSGILFVSQTALAFSVADTGLNTTARAARLQTETSLPAIAGNIIGAVLALIGVVFMALMIYGGFLWMTARGNEQQVETAKSLITSAVIGAVIVASGYAITSFVIDKTLSATGAGSGGGGSSRSADDSSGGGGGGGTIDPGAGGGGGGAAAGGGAATGDGAFSCTIGGSVSTGFADDAASACSSCGDGTATTVTFEGRSVSCTSGAAPTPPAGGGTPPAAPGCSTPPGGPGTVGCPAGMTYDFAADQCCPIP